MTKYFVYVLNCFHLDAMVGPQSCRILPDREFSFQVAATDKLVITIHFPIKNFTDLKWTVQKNEGRVVLYKRLVFGLKVKSTGPIYIGYW